MKTKKEIKEFYGKNYKPNKNAVPVTYKGTKYLSKAQCMALEGITRKELDAYLKGEVNDSEVTPVKKIQFDDEPTNEFDIVTNDEF